MKNFLTYLAQEGIKINPSEVKAPSVNLDQNTLQGMLSTVFLVIGGLAVLIILIGAVNYAISQGDAGQVQKAKNTILYAVVGLVISLMAFAIVQFALGAVLG